MAALSRGCKPRIPTWRRDINGGEGAVISPPRGIAQMTNYCLLLLSAIVSIVLSKIKSFQGRIIAGISSKSEVLPQLRAKGDSYTVLKGWSVTMALGRETPFFTKIGLGFI